MALETEIGARLWPDLPVGVVARRAVESDCAADLVWVGKILLYGLVRMATVADVWRDRTHCT
jgi:hypothetical protein